MHWRLLSEAIATAGFGVLVRSSFCGRLPGYRAIHRIFLLPAAGGR